MCVPLNRQQKRSKKHVYFIRYQWIAILFTDEYKCTLTNNSVHLMMREESQIRFRKLSLFRSTFTEYVGLSFGQGLSWLLHCCASVLYRDSHKTLGRVTWLICPSIHTAIIKDFILTTYFARSHRVLLVEDFLKGYSLKWMEWTYRSPILNPREHVW